MSPILMNLSHSFWTMLSFCVLIFILVPRLNFEINSGVTVNKQIDVLDLDRHNVMSMDELSKFDDIELNWQMHDAKCVAHKG